MFIHQLWNTSETICNVFFIKCHQFVPIELVCTNYILALFFSIFFTILFRRWRFYEIDIYNFEHSVKRFQEMCECSKVTRVYIISVRFNIHCKTDVTTLIHIHVNTEDHDRQEMLQAKCETFFFPSSSHL